MKDERKTTLQDIPYRVSLAMRGAGCAQVAAAVEEYLPGGQARRDGEETWIIDDCLGRMWVAIGGTDDIDAMSSLSAFSANDIDFIHPFAGKTLEYRINLVNVLS